MRISDWSSDVCSSDLLRPAEAWRTVITLPWPPAILSPNSRSHWARKLEPKQRYRLDCYMLTKGYLATARHWRPSPVCPLPVKITFCPPDRRQDRERPRRYSSH